jgi:hypothetical protein
MKIWCVEAERAGGVRPNAVDVRDVSFWNWGSNWNLFM